MSTGIVILNFNNAAATIDCIRSIEKFNTAPVKYYVVDNGSTKEGDVALLSEKLLSLFGNEFVSIPAGSSPEKRPHLTLILSQKNHGYAGGNNLGLEIAYQDDEIDNILIINNDILFVEDIIPVLLTRYGELDHPGLISPLLYKRDGKRTDVNCARLCPTNWDIILPLYWHNHKRKEINEIHERSLILYNHPEYAQQPSIPIELPSGSCMFASKEVIRSIGGFDDGTFLYFEENILFRKLSSLGLQNYCIPGIHAIHLGAESTRKIGDLFLQRCMVDSANHYLKRYGKMTLPQRIVWDVTRIGWSLTFFIKKHILKKRP